MEEDRPVTPEQFSAWLVPRLEARGYDLTAPRSGDRTRLALDTGLSAATISRALLGRLVPGPEALTKLAAILQVPPQEIYMAAGLLERPAAGSPLVTVDAALDAWGISRPDDRALVAALVKRLRQG